MATAIHTGIQLYFISPTGERIGILSDDNYSGKILSFEINEKVQGGVDTFSFQIARDNEIPISRNTEVYVYIEGEVKFTGYISSIPEPDQDDPVLTIEGLGFYTRLDKKIINRSYTSETLYNIVTDMLSNELDYSVGVVYDATLIDLPAISDITIEFDDTKLLDALADLLKVANYDYDNHKYRFFIDNDKKLNIEEWGADILETLFEGFQYQTPSVEVDSSRIKNKLLCYRTSAADSSEVEYVTTVEDTDSQDEEGVFESKLVLPTYTDLTTLTNMANSIISRYKAPQKTEEIENLIVSGPKPFGLYALSNRRQKYWDVVNSCNSLTGWSSAGLLTASLSMSSDHVLTGRQSIKCEANGSENEYFEYTLDNPIPLPQKLRIYTYFEATVMQFKVDFYDRYNNITSLYLGISEQALLADTGTLSDEPIATDSYGEEAEIVVNTVNDIAINQWLILEQEVGFGSSEERISANLTGATEDDIVVNTDETTVEYLEARKSSNANITDISKIRVTILTGSAGTFYIDRLDTYADTYKTAHLLLEEATYNLSEVGKFMKAKFGESVDSLVEEVKEQVKNGDVALSVFAKQ